jgi:hypothetical protein
MRGLFMDAVRIFQKPDQGILIIQLPEHLAQSKELEIIIIPVIEDEQLEKEPFIPSDYYGVWQEKDIDADKVSKEIREEWNRDF